MSGTLDPRPSGIVIAVVGAESTGKTTLVAELAAAIPRVTGLACAGVDEWLRLWCDREGRTPRPEEQAAICAEQAARIARAASGHPIVVADTTPLMTALYSSLLFGDESLRDEALRWHRAHCDLTLLTALDLPWVADGHQRDGEHVRAPVDTLLRRWLGEAGIGWSLVAGHGPQRVQAALDATTALLRRRARTGSGLFTRLAEREAQREAALNPGGADWVCADCDDPACEHRLRRTTA